MSSQKGKRVALACAAGLGVGAAAYVLWRRSKVRAAKLASRPPASADRILLPTVLKPQHYQLFLQPDLEAFTFTGTVSISVEASAATRVVVCHAAELAVTRVVAIDRAGRQEALSIVLDGGESAQTVTATFAQPLSTETTTTLLYEFSGTLNDQMHGFYRSSYAGESGETRYMATTQFESTDARRAFPCFDEPALKATFSVTLRVPSDRTALSNMPLMEQRPVAGEGALTDCRFETTPSMSTYLLAFCVGEFESVEEVTAEGVVVRVHTPPGLREQGRFALGVASQALSFFADYFGYEYPLPKLDCVAVPDFAAGAMENWGLVTFRTALVLFDVDTSGSESKQRIAYVVCHELAHQWFGNLVTMEWWTHLWLNEGFATWAGWLAVDRLFPEWDVWTQFLANEQARGLELDALASSHPVEVEIADSARVGAIFDAISYSKGASVIHMLAAWLGEGVFQEGMRHYVRTHAWGNASTEQLWEALGEASGIPVHIMMRAWTQTTGFPVVRVEGTPGGGPLHLTQSRFLSVPSAAEPLSEAEAQLAPRWMLPLRLLTDAGVAVGGADLLTDHSAPLALPPGARWAKLNGGQSGFYRVAYASQALWEPLAAAAPGLPPADRAGLVSDAFALAAAGVAPTVPALQLLASLGGSGERNFCVWAAACGGLGSLASAMAEAPATQQLRLFGARLLAPLAAACGWAEGWQEGHLDALLRTLALSKAGELGDPATLRAARARFARFVAGDAAALPPGLRAPAFRALMMHGGEAELDALVAVYRAADPGAAGQELRVAALQAVGCGPSPALARRALDFALHAGCVRSQDIMYAVASCAANPAARREAWAHLRGQWGALAARLGDNSSLLARLCALATERLAGPKDADELLAWHAALGAPAGVAVAVAQSAEKIRANAAWAARDGEAVAAWLAALGCGAEEAVAARRAACEAAATGGEPDAEAEEEAEEAEEEEEEEEEEEGEEGVRV